jgi:hypothetical protein
MRPKNWVESGQDEIVEFDVHCRMKKCWANEFLSLLADMQLLGEIGSSRIRGFYCDGDGDFRPKFTHNFKDFIKTTPIKSKPLEDGIDIFDAG